MSDVYRVDTRDAAYILKVYMHGRHSRGEIEAEVNFLNDLLDHDIAVAAPVANNDGAYLDEIDAPEGTRCAVLFDALSGDEPQEVKSWAQSQLRAIGWPVTQLRRPVGQGV